MSNYQTIASAGKNNIVKLWNLNTKETRTINNYGTLDLSFSLDGKSITMVNKDNSIKSWSLDGTLFKSIGVCCDNSIKMSLRPGGTALAFVNRYTPNDIIVMRVNYQSAHNSYRIIDRNEISPAHSDVITSLNFSPDGQLLASASKDKVVKIWRLNSFPNDNQTIEALRLTSDRNIVAVGYRSKIEFRTRDNQLKQSFPGDGAIFDLSADKKHIVAASTDDFIKVWTLNGKELVLKGHTGAITSVNLSPDGNLIASSGEDKTVKLWNRDGTLLKTLVGHTKSITNVRFSPDGKVLASIGEDNVTKLWRNNGTLIRTLSGHFHKISDVVFSPNSQTIASIGDDNLIKLWKTDGTFIKILVGHSSIVQYIDFSPDSQTIASVSGGNTDSGEINFWRSQDGTLLKSINDPGIGEVHFSPNSQMVATSNRLDNTVKLWSLKGTLLATLKGHNAPVISLDFNSNKEILATGSADNTIKLWSFNGKLLQTLFGHNDAIQSVAFSPDGKRLVSASNDNVVKLWSAEGKELKTLQTESSETDKFYNYRNNIVNFSSDGSIVALVNQSEDYATRLWNREGKEIKRFQGHRSYYQVYPRDSTVSSLSQDGRTIALVSRDNALKIWNLNGTLQASLTGHSDSINQVSFSPDGTLIASASDDKTAKIWRTDGTLIRTLPHIEKVNQVSFSPDGTLIASASDDKTAKIWRTDGTLINTLKHNAKVTAVSFSPDGATIASASDDETAKIWSRDGTLLQILRHDDKVNRLVFSPDGQSLASASQDGITKLWNVKNGREITSIKGNSRSEFGLRFSPDSKILAVIDSGSNSGEAKFYFIDNVWFKNASFTPGIPLSDLRFTSDGKEILVSTNEKILSLGLFPDNVLALGCRWTKDYLTSNPNRQTDRHLCDGISPLR